MSETPSTPGDDELDQEIFTALQRRIDERRGRPLTAEQQRIVHDTYIRVLGHDREGNVLGSDQMERDVKSVVAMNNSLVIRPEDLASNESLAALRKRGWQAYSITDETVHCEVLQQAGYGFVVEHQAENGGITPYGFQLGFPFMPRHMANLSLPTIWPQISVFTEHEMDTMQIWRTSIINCIECVRGALERIGFPVNPELLDQRLQGMGAGVATKLVDAVAAKELAKFRVQCNIAEIVRTGSHDEIIAKNEVSFGSAGTVFDAPKRYHRTRVDPVMDGSVVTAEMFWRILSAAPDDMIQRAEAASSPIVRKNWIRQRLHHAGHVLAHVLKAGTLVPGGVLRKAASGS